MFLKKIHIKIIHSTGLMNYNLLFPNHIALKNSLIRQIIDVFECNQLRREHSSPIKLHWKIFIYMASRFF